MVAIGTLVLRVLRINQVECNFHYQIRNNDTKCCGMKTQVMWTRRDATTLSISCTHLYADIRVQFECNFDCVIKVGNNDTTLKQEKKVQVIAMQRSNVCITIAFEYSFRHIRGIDCIGLTC